MRTVLFFFLLPAALSGVDLWTPVIGSGVCTVTFTSGATPIRVTVSDISKCSVIENATIWVQGVNNIGSSATRSSANIHMDNSSDEAGLCRVAKNITGNRFDLYKCDGTTPVAPNGIYSYGGQVALAQPRTLKDLPITWFDGSGGYLANCLVNTGAGGCAQPGRLEWTALSTKLATLPDLTVKHQDFQGHLTAVAALGWWSENKPSSSTYRTKMLNGVMNSFPIPTTACDNSIDCSYSPSQYSDYAYEVTTPGFIFSMNLGMSALNTSQKATLRNYYFGDYPWTKGGHNYSGTTLAFPPFKTPATGVISFITGANTVTGVGTSFLSEVAVGDLILLRYNESYARWYPVASIESNTALTLARTVELDFGTAGVNGPFNYRLAAPWSDNGSDMGYLGLSHMNSYTLLCGAGIPSNTSCSDYAPGAGGAGLDAMHNHQLGRISYLMMLALTWASQEPRARWLAIDSMFVWYHNLYPAITNMGGIAADSSHYHISRILPYIETVVGGLQNSFADGPDYTGGGVNGATWWDEIAKYALNTFVPGRQVTQFQHNGEGGAYACCGSGAVPGLFVELFKPLSTFASGLKYYIQNDWGEYNVSSILSNDGTMVPLAYVGNRPDITAIRSTQTSLITTAPLAAGCAAQWSPSICGSDRRFFFGSRAGTTLANAWNGSGVNIFFNMMSLLKRDHAGQVHDVGPMIAANGRILMAGDGYLGLFDSIPHGNVFVIGAESNIRNGGGADGTGISVPLYIHGTPSLAAAGVNITGHYKVAAGVTAHRSILHAKASGLGYIIQRDDFTVSSSTTARTYNHYWTSEGCGTPSSSPCITLNRAAGTVSHLQNFDTVAKLNSRFLGGTLNTANSSDSDGSYPGQADKTFRVTNSTSGNSGSLYAVHQVSTSAGTSLPPMVESASGAYKIIEIQDPSAPVVAILAPVATVNLTGVSLTTTHAGTGQYVVTGLAAGTYVIRRDGTPISADPLPVAAGEHVLNFTSLSGSFVIDTGPPPLSILTTMLPNAVLGKTYIGTVVGDSSTQPYSWDITSGSLCAGLTLTPGSQTATIGGVALNLGTCTFTVRVRNATLTSSFSRQFTITVVPPGSGTVTILTTRLPVARTLELYTATLKAQQGTPPYRWGITAGALCGGLALEPETGVISGSTAGEGDCIFTVRATDLGNEFHDRSFTLTRIPDRQTPLYISAAEASFSAAVVRFGHRGLAFNQACTLDIRLGGAAGSVVQSLTSASGASRRQLVAVGLPAGQTYHLTATCGVETATAQMETGFPPGQARPVVLRMTRPTLNGIPVDVVISFGSSEAMPNSIVTPCTATECTATIDTADPLLYWSAQYRNAGGVTLARTAIHIRAPR